MAINVESFEDVQVGSNAPLLFAGAIRVGASAPFTFASGIAYSAPVPNTALVPLFVADLDQGWVVGASPINSSTIPGGAAFLNIGTQLATFTLGTPAHTVSVKMSDNDVMGIAAYDAAGRLVTVAASRPATAAEWAGNVVQVMSKTPIHQIVLLGNEAAVDDLTLDTGKPKILKASGRNDTIKGKNKSEFIDGKNGNDRIDGRGGDDTLFGGKGKDKLKGGAGNDAISGGDGPDILTGGEGEDTFLFGPLGWIDEIRDFDPFDDTMVLPRSVFAKFSTVNEYLQSHQFVVGAAALDADDFLLYDFTTGGLFYDVDGIGPTPPMQFARLNPGLAR